MQAPAHVQPARNLQGVAYAPGSAQHEQSVGTVSPTLGRRPQLQRPDACMKHQQACTPITTPAAHARGREAEFTQVGGWDSSSDSDAGHSVVEESDRGNSSVEGSDEGNRAVEGSEEYFDESEHVDGFTAEERSTDGEEVDESEGEDGRGRRGVTLRRRRVMRKVARMRKRVTRRCGMRCRKPCQRWGMKSMTRPPRLIFAQGLKRRDPLQQHHPKCQCGLRMCLVYLYLFISCVQLRLSSEDFQW